MAGPDGPGNDRSGDGALAASMLSASTVPLALPARNGAYRFDRAHLAHRSNTGSPPRLHRPINQARANHASPGLGSCSPSEMDPHFCRCQDVHGA